MTTAFIRTPKTAQRGDVMEISALIRHKMESGHRRDQKGEAIPRNIINTFEARYNGEVVFEMTLFPAISANPFIRFHTIAAASGDIVFTWKDDAGETYTQTKSITVT